MENLGNWVLARYKWGSERYTRLELEGMLVDWANTTALEPRRLVGSSWEDWTGPVRNMATGLEPRRSAANKWGHRKKLEQGLNRPVDWVNKKASDSGRNKLEVSS